MPTKKSKSNASKAATPAAKKASPKTKAAKASGTTKKSAPKKSSAKKSAAKKTAVKSAAKKPAAKKPAAVKKSAAKKPAAKKAAPKSTAAKKPASKTPVVGQSADSIGHPRKLSATTLAFFKRQEGKLLALKDSLLDSLTGMAKDSLRSQAEGGDASAFGMHQADAGSDAYDRDFALSLLSQEQDSLFEIDEALNRLKAGTYGICEMSQKPIPRPRLEALPFTRYTVECQAELEKNQHRQRNHQPVASLFGSSDDDRDDEDRSSDSKD